MKWKDGMTRYAWLAVVLGLVLMIAGAVLWSGREEGLDGHGQLILGDDPDGVIYCVSTQWGEDHNAEYIFAIR